MSQEIYLKLRIVFIAAKCRFINRSVSKKVCPKLLALRRDNLFSIYALGRVGEWRGWGAGFETLCASFIILGYLCPYLPWQYEGIPYSLFTLVVELVSGGGGVQGSKPVAQGSPTLVIGVACRAGEKSLENLIFGLILCLVKIRRNWSHDFVYKNNIFHQFITLV